MLTVDLSHSRDDEFGDCDLQNLGLVIIAAEGPESHNTVVLQVAP